MSNTTMTVGVIGGSGLYAISGIENMQEVVIDTPYGAPSDAFMVGELAGVRVVFLARHGRNHSFLPTEIPFRANIYAMKKLGVRHLVSLSAVGSLREHMRPRDMVVVDQYIDYTKQRVSSFFGEGLSAHISMAKPTCEVLSALVYAAASEVLAGSQQKVYASGTYICMEGPQFSTYAESKLYQSLGIDIIGMTNMPEAKLAREAQIAYASLAMVTDYDCWHTTEEAVSMDMALAHLKANADNAQKIVGHIVRQLAIKAPTSLAHSALDMAIITPYEALSEEKKALLHVLQA